LAEVVNAVDMLKPSLRGEQFDDLLHTDVRLVMRRTNDCGPPALAATYKDRDSVGRGDRRSIVGDG
jgi:hypothetical protein